MFKFNTLTGNGSAQEILNMPSELEGCIHSVNFLNSNGSNETISFDVGGKTFSHAVPSGASTFGFKVNVPSTTSVKVTAQTGVEIAISYIEQAIDSSGALNNIQQAAANAETSLQALVTQAENHVANLPDGTINDSVPGSSTTFSSNKINTELGNKQSIVQSGYNQIDDATISTGTHTLDYALGDYQKITASGDFTFAANNFVSDKVCTFIIELVNGGDHAITFPATWQFEGKTAPPLTPGGTDMLMVIKDKNEVFSLFVMGQGIGAV